MEGMEFNSCATESILLKGTGPYICYWSHRDFLNRVFTAFHLCSVLKSLGGAVTGWQQVFIGSDGDGGGSELTKAQLSPFLQAQRSEQEDW